MSDLILHAESYSNHGTATGIHPRFFLQMHELWTTAFGSKSEYENNSTYYFDHFLPTLETLYDLYHEIFEIDNEYVEGIKTKKYYTKDPKGQTYTDRTKESLINYKVKNFFIYHKTP